jgi:wobble nucleotide-excising tRNase
LRSLEEHNVTLADSVVVIDDPVSSLDSSNLLAASSFIWSRLVGKSAQLFLFTHSFELFRTWSQLLKGAKITLDKQGKSGLLFELRAKYEMVDGEPRRLVKLRNWPKHPEATRLRSEYQYLFSQVLDGLSDLQNDPSEAQLMNAAALLPNATRRVLEGFLAFKRPQEIGDLRGQLKGAKPPDLDDELWQRVLRFADDYSHMEHADTDRHLERPEVLGHLQAVLAFIGDVDPTHVSDMCQALDRPKPNLSIS